MTVTSQPFGKTADGQAVTQFTLRNQNGMSVDILSYGAVIRRIFVPDTNGVLRDVALGYDSVQSYEKNDCFFGALVGRYANRIQNAQFSLDGNTYRLQPNAGRHHLHGTFSFRVYEGTTDRDSVVFHFTSPPSEEGYPGALQVTVRYRLTEDNALEINYSARTDADTVVNLTNHSYFNLNGHGSGDILRHSLQLDAACFTEIDSEGIPTGRILPVTNTALDFRTPKKIGADIGSSEPQMVFAGGYDHNFILDKPSGTRNRCAVAKGEQSGIVLTMCTTEPAVQLYTGNYVRAMGKNGVRYAPFCGFALEAQHYLCSPNFPQFPSTVLHPGETYRQTTVYRFSAI